MFAHYPKLAPPSLSARLTRVIRDLSSETMALLTQAMRLLALWRRRARTRAELRRLCDLDPHILKDIGLGPDEVRREMSLPFWQ